MSKDNFFLTNNDEGTDFPLIRLCINLNRINGTSPKTGKQQKKEGSMSKLPWIDSALVDLAYKRFENQEERFDSDRKLLLPKLKQKQAGTEKKQVSISSSESPCH